MLLVFPPLTITIKCMTTKNKKRSDRHKEFIRNYKEQRPCERCQENFHHASMGFYRNDTTKTPHKISQMSMWSKKKILEEIQNSQLLCANCLSYLFWEKSKQTTNDPLSIRGRTHIAAAKTDVSCADCNTSYHPSSMQFDHRPGEIKRRNISKMERYSIENIQKEIDKCDIVCNNCHNRRTYNRLYS